MEKETKEFIAKKYAQKWVDENKKMMEDYQDICANILMFKAMWGIEIGIIIKNTEEAPKGRVLGAGAVEQMTNIQETINKHKQPAP